MQISLYTTPGTKAVAASLGLLNSWRAGYKAFLSEFSKLSIENWYW